MKGHDLEVKTFVSFRKYLVQNLITLKTSVIPSCSLTNDNHGN